MRTRHLLCILPLSLVATACEINDVLSPVDRDAPYGLAYQLIPSGDPNVPLGVLLTWSPPQSGRAVTFDVYGRSSSGAAWDRRATTTSPSFHDAGMPQLSYYVVAQDGQGNELGQSNIITIDERNRLPAPAGLMSISLNHAVQLSWSGNAVTAGNGAFDYYRVYSSTYSAAQGLCANDWSLEGTTVSDAFLASNLANGASRCFAVSAVSRDGHESTWSAPRQDTPRVDARNVLVYSHDSKPESAGFLFYDESAKLYGVVTSATRLDLDFTVERHTDGTLWFSPARSDVKMGVYGSTGVADLTSIDRASGATLGAVTAEAVPGYGYVFSTKKSDGTHYAAVRVAFAGTNYLVLDWAYQNAAGNPELSRAPSDN